MRGDDGIAHVLDETFGRLAERCRTAERERDEANDFILLLRRIVVDPADATYAEVKALEPGNTARACMAIDLANAMEARRACARLRQEAERERDAAIADRDDQAAKRDAAEAECVFLCEGRAELRRERDAYLKSAIVEVVRNWPGDGHMWAQTTEYKVLGRQFDTREKAEDFLRHHIRSSLGLDASTPPEARGGDGEPSQ